MNPTSSNPAQDELIRVRAYEIWCGKGYPDGSAEQDWLEATAQVTAEVARNGSDLATCAPQDAQETAPRAAQRPRLLDARHVSPAPAPAAKRPGPARAVARGASKPETTDARTPMEQKREQKPAQKPPATADQKPTPPAYAAERAPAPAASAAETRVGKPAEGGAKGGPAKARGRGRAAGTNKETPLLAPATPQLAASGAGTHPVAAQSAAAPTSGAAAKQGRRTRTGGRRDAGTRQRRG